MTTWKNFPQNSVYFKYSQVLLNVSCSMKKSIRQPKPPKKVKNQGLRSRGTPTFQRWMWFLFSSVRSSFQFSWKLQNKKGLQIHSGAFLSADAPLSNLLRISHSILKNGFRGLFSYNVLFYSYFQLTFKKIKYANRYWWLCWCCCPERTGQRERMACPGGHCCPGIQQPSGRCRWIKTQKAKWQREMWLHRTMFWESSS